MKTRLFGWSIITALLAVPSVFADSLQLISAADSSLNRGGSGDSHSAIISHDGRFVLFASAANNLVAGTNGVGFSGIVPARNNVFLRDRANGTTLLVSLNLAENNGGNGDSFPADLSTNGHYVLFESSASDLVANDTNSMSDIFIRDLINSSNILVSVSTNGDSANNFSRNPAFTPDGRYVAFISAAANLVPDDVNGIEDVFVRDMQTGTTVLASPGAMKAGTYSRPESPDISDDGRYVAFSSTATNLIPGVNTAGEIYLRDLVANVTLQASIHARSSATPVLGTNNIVCYNHALSADGKYVAFEASQSSGSINPGLILRYGLDSGLTDVVHTNAWVSSPAYDQIQSLEITPDGRFIAFIANTNDSSTTSVQVWDAQTGATVLASGDLGGAVPANSTCRAPAINATGRFVAFLSTGALTAGSSNDRLLYIRDLQSASTALISVNTNGGSASVLSYAFSGLSDDGRSIVFESNDRQVAQGNQNDGGNVFVRDTLAGATALVSAPVPTLVSQSPNASSFLSSASVSHTGRYIAFVSDADNIVTNDTNGNRDVFVRDLLNHTNYLVSYGANGSSADGFSWEPAISSDGRYVAFSSTATNLTGVDTNRASDVYVRDMQTGSILLGSIASSVLASGNAASFSPSISTNGKYLLFHSKASNLTLGISSSGTENLFLRNLENSTTVALTTSGGSTAVMTPNGLYVAFIGANTLYVWDTAAGKKVYTNITATFKSIAISPNGNRLAYSSSSEVRVIDRLINSNWLIGASSSSATAEPKFSSDARFLTYVSAVAQTTGDVNGLADVYLYDLQAQSKTLVSKAYNSVSGATAPSGSPAISTDGRFVAYRSTATNIDLTAASGWPNLFLYDRLSSTNSLLSRSRSGTEGGNYWSFPPIFSGDGRSIVFTSGASNLSVEDFNQGADLFAFSFLYLSATRGSQGALLSWPAISSQSYKVQFKNNIDDINWQDLSGTISFNNNQGSIEDPSEAAAHRFYRVIGF